MFQDVIDRLKETEKQIRELERQKAQAQHFLAFVVKKMGRFEVDTDELYKVDYMKVKLQPVEQEPSKLIMFYENN